MAGIGAYVNKKLGDPAGKAWKKTVNTLKEKSPFEKSNNSRNNPISNESTHSSTYQHQYKKYNTAADNSRHSQVLSPRNMGGLHGEPYKPSTFEKIIDDVERNVKNVAREGWEYLKTGGKIAGKVASKVATPLAVGLTAIDANMRYHEHINQGESPGEAFLKSGVEF
jgi:hypothetical protein